MTFRFFFFEIFYPLPLLELPFLGSPLIQFLWAPSLRPSSSDGTRCHLLWYPLSPLNFLFEPTIEQTLAPFARLGLPLDPPLTTLDLLGLEFSWAPLAIPFGALLDPLRSSLDPSWILSTLIGSPQGPILSLTPHALEAFMIMVTWSLLWSPWDPLEPPLVSLL